MGVDPSGDGSPKPPGVGGESSRAPVIVPDVCQESDCGPCEFGASGSTFDSEDAGDRIEYVWGGPSFDRKDLGPKAQGVDDLRVGRG